MIRRLSRYGLAVAVAGSILIAPGAAQGKKEERTLRDIYKSLYSKVEKEFGNGAAGRHIVKDGVEGKTDDRPAKDGEIARSIRTMRNMLNPPVPTSSSVVIAETEGTPVAGGSGSLASIRACESGGNYQTNTGNGYSGAYQFDQQTWKAAGGSTEHAYQASPAEQDRVAAGWIAAGHRGAWPNC